MQPTQPLTTTRLDIVIRAADPADRPALEAIAAQTWEGRDYLPRVLDRWFRDPHGGFFVATLHGQVAGVIKLTRFAPEEWWIEGLRVDPAFQGQGVSRVLHHFAVNRLRQMGEGVARFSTSSDNRAVRKLANETGFQHVASYLAYGADVLREPVESLAALGPDDAARVRAWLDASAHYVEAQRSLEQNWSYYFITGERLAACLESGLVYGWPGAYSESNGGRAALGGVVIVNPLEKSQADDPVLRVGYLDAPVHDLAAVGRDVRRLAASLDRGRVRIKAFKQADRLAALESAGYECEWDSEAWLYARDVRLTQHADVRTEQIPPVK